MAARGLGLSTAPGRAWVITVSDSCARGEAEDRSGPAVGGVLAEAGFDIAGTSLVADDEGAIADMVEEAISAGAHLVVTTGGTGLAARDVTPQATARLVEYQVPGLAEEMRRAGAASTPYALLSRGVAGVRRGALVLNLPGSTAGATESLRAVLPALPHALRLLAGDTSH